MQWRAVQASGDEAVPARRNSLRDTPRILLTLEPGKDARTGTGETRARARIARRRLRIELRIQPVEGRRHIGIARTHGRLTDIASLARREGAYSDRGRISCQFRGLEDLRSTYRYPGMDDQEPALRQAHGLQPLAAALPPGRMPVHEQRYVGAEAQPQLGKLRDRESGAPEAIEAKQHGRGIRAAAAESPARRDMFNHMQLGAKMDAGLPLQRARRAYHQVLLRRETGHSCGALDAAILAPREADAIAQVDQLKQRLQLVIAVC